MTTTKQTVSRGRPRTFDPEKGVEIAEQLFRERGYDAVGVAELVSVIGIRPPSFYAAYGSKKALLKRVLDRYGHCDGHFIQELIGSDAPLADTAERLFLQAADTYGRDPGKRGCLVLEGTRNSGDAGACELTRRARTNLHDQLVNWVSAQAPAAAQDLAHYVLTLLAGISAEARAGTSPAQLRVSAEIAALGFRTELERRLN